MALATVHSRALTGIAAAPVTVEVDLAAGLPAFTIVGLPETAVKEAKDRVRAAIHNSGFEFPAKRITVNLDITPDEDNPYATLSAQDDGGDTLAEVKVAAGFKLNRSTAVAWADGGFAKPR